MTGSEGAVPRAEIDFIAGTVWLDGARWLGVDDHIDAAEITHDAELLRDYIASFATFFGSAADAIEAYWAFLVWLYAAPAAPFLRQAAVPAGIDPWIYPVYAVLFGRSSGGKTAFARIAARSMFGFDQQLSSRQFTATKAIGLRAQLGAIPLLLDDITRERFTSHVPDLVRTDQVMSALYAPIILTTNRDVTTIPPDLTKRMVTCHIDAAIPENRSRTGSLKRRVERGLNTSLYRAYLQRLIPAVGDMRAAMLGEIEGTPPDLLKVSATVLRETLGAALGDLPAWARPLEFDDYFGIRHRRFRDQLAALQQESGERIAVNRHNGEVLIDFGGDMRQAEQFAKSVPDFILKGRVVDRVRLDLVALENEMGFAVRRSAWWRRLLGATTR